MEDSLSSTGAARQRLTRHITVSQLAEPRVPRKEQRVLSEINAYPIPHPYPKKPKEKHHRYEGGREGGQEGELKKWTVHMPLSSAFMHFLPCSPPAWTALVFHPDSLLGREGAREGRRDDIFF